MYPVNPNWGFPPSIVMKNFTIEKIEVFSPWGTSQPASTMKSQTFTIPGESFVLIA